MKQKYVELTEREQAVADYYDTHGVTWEEFMEAEARGEVFYGGGPGSKGCGLEDVIKFFKEKAKERAKAEKSAAKIAAKGQTAAPVRRVAAAVL